MGLFQVACTAQVTELLCVIQSKMTVKKDVAQKYQRERTRCPDHDGDRRLFKMSKTGRNVSALRKPAEYFSHVRCDRTQLFKWSHGVGGSENAS
jgi:hypothetical protein